MFPTLFLKVLGRMVQYGIYNLLSTFMLMINGLLHNLRFVKKKSVSSIIPIPCGPYLKVPTECMVKFPVIAILLRWPGLIFNVDD